MIQPLERQQEEVRISLTKLAMIVNGSEVRDMISMTSFGKCLAKETHLPVVVMKIGIMLFSGAASQTRKLVIIGRFTSQACLVANET